MSNKRHLRVSIHSTRAACGLSDPPHWSFLASEVTCGGCSKTMKMADAEVMEQQNKKDTEVRSPNKKGRL